MGQPNRDPLRRICNLKDSELDRLESQCDKVIEQVTQLRKMEQQITHEPHPDNELHDLLFAATNYKRSIGSVRRRRELMKLIGR